MYEQKNRDFQQTFKKVENDGDDGDGDDDDEGDIVVVVVDTYQELEAVDNMDPDRLVEVADNSLDLVVAVVGSMGLVQDTLVVVEVDSNHLPLEQAVEYIDLYRDRNSFQFNY